MSKALAVTYVPPRSLKPYAGNARTHSKHQIRQIADSIRQFGFTNPILVDGQRTVIAGHGRLKAAETLGLDTVPTIKLAHLGEAERRAYILADNKLAEKAGWDPEILRIELQYLANADLRFDLTLTGFETPEIDLALGPAPSADPEQVPALDPDQPVVTRPGDLWELGPHRLLCGDATQPANVRTLMGQSKAGMVFIDPPYNVAIDGNARGLGKHRFDPFAMASGEMSRDRFTAFLTDALALLARHSTDGSIHYVCMDWRHLREVVTAGESTYGPLLNLAVYFE